MIETLTFVPNALIGSARPASGADWLAGGQWYQADAINDGLSYQFEAGTLAAMHTLWFDMMIDTPYHTVFMIQLQEGESGPTFWFSFSLLHDCQGRVRVPLEATLQNRWIYAREGAVLKRLSRWQRVDLARVDRMRLIVHRDGGLPSRWCMTPIVASRQPPPLLENPLLPKGALLDAFGQSTVRVWDGKTHDENTLIQRIQQQAQQATSAVFPQGYSAWGGDNSQQGEARGYFRVQYDGQQWQMIDPDGHPFWSMGQCCVHAKINAAYTHILEALTLKPNDDPRFKEAFTVVENEFGYEGRQEVVNTLAPNLIRALGKNWYEPWKKIALGWLKTWGFNTIANFSDWRIGQESGFPYVRQLDYVFPRSKFIYRDLPDVFDANFALDAADFAYQLIETRDDPALIGYFLMNEPQWGFARESLAEGILFNAPPCATRQAIADWLRQQYAEDDELSRAWGMTVTFDQIANALWRTPLTESARVDLFRCSTYIAQQFFSTLSAACRVVDTHHLNLGARFHTVPPDWVLLSMASFDVFSMNCYQPRVPSDALAHIHETIGLPTIIGEWHFGALDVGLPASGIGHVRDQTARGEAYRYYVEQAAALPHCLGTHHFTLYDQSSLGRSDGESYNIGFVDVCHRPYEPLVEAAQSAHQKVYAIRRGDAVPFDTPPEYLPRLFF